MNKILNTILLTTCLFVSTVRAELPGWYPDNYDAVGIVSSIEYNSITFGGYKHKLSPTVKVSTVGKSNDSFKLIQTGLTVGAKFITINNRNLVDRLWLIPEDELVLIP